MEDRKRIHKFFGREGEYYLLWTAQTQAAMEHKECIAAIQEDVIGSVDISNLTDGVRCKWHRQELF